MYQIRNNNTGVLIHASLIETIAREQIDKIALHPAFRELIAIMPDVHAGAGCVVGFTGKFKKSVIPNIVGFDIGCGVMTYRLKLKKIDFVILDAFIRENIPTGFNSRKRENLSKVFNDTIFGTELNDFLEIVQKSSDFVSKNNLTGNPSLQVGTLGGGNHFIEVEQGTDGELYLTVHSGSRNFGLQVANFYQRKAKELMEEMNISVPKDLEYLPLSSGGNEYLEMMKIAQKYAYYNRLIMIRLMLMHLGETFEQERLIESVHNYISFKDGITRKGAISAHKGEKVVIPLHMGAGIVLGTGKGNREYNYSAPHGAGRTHGRKDMKRMLASGEITMDLYRQSMEGVYSTSITENTIDESRFAYKDFKDIEIHLRETVDVEQIAKPVFNLKADGGD